MLNIYNPNQQSGNLAKPLPIKEDAPKADFRRYQDVSGDFDNKELTYSLWWIKNKVLLYRILVAILIGTNALLIFFNIGKWGAYIYGITEANRMELTVSRFNNYNAIKDRFSPLPLQFSEAKLLSGGVGKVDAVVEVTNPNPQFTVTLLYRFALGATTTESKMITLLAGESNILAILGVDEALVSNGTVIFQLQKTDWQRIDNHKIQNPVSWQNERLSFFVSSSVFQNAFEAGGLKTNRIAFGLQNNSPYSYKTPSFIVGLYNAGGLVGVLPLQTGNFLSMEEKPIELRSFAGNLSVGEIKIFPQLNIYDDAVYLPPER